MATADPIQESVVESAVHTLTENEVADQDTPHVILRAENVTNEQSRYIRLLEERLSELEKKVTGLVESKNADEKAIDEGVNNNDEERSDAEKSDEEKAEEEKEEDKDGKSPEEDPVIFTPEVRKFNVFNFTNRFPNQTHISAIEALMVDTTLDAAFEEDKIWSTMLESSKAADALQEMNTSLESNLYKTDAWMARIRLNPPSLVKEVTQIIKPDENVTAPFVFECPFQPLMESHGKIKARLEELQEKSNPSQSETVTTADEEDAQLLQFLECYVEFMEKEVINLYERKRTKVRFAALSAIFQLGDTIFVPHTGKASKPDPEMLSNRENQRLWRLYRTIADRDTIELKCYAIDYDGESYVCIKKSFFISSFVGEQSISSLSVFPLQYADNAEQIRAECVAQGQLFLDFIKVKLLSHNGWALDSGPNDEMDSSLQYITSDVVVDFAEALKVHSSWKPDWQFPNTKEKGLTVDDFTVWKWEVDETKGASHRTINDNYWESNQLARLRKIEYCTKRDPFLSSWSRDQSKSYKLREQDLELLPRRLFSYVLQERKFVAVDIQNLKSVEDNWTHSRNLIINKDHESMLRALIHSHFKRKELHDTLGLYSIGQDIIANKGRGLVILLYGVPGVGKTSTAENIAHSWKRPLLPVTCGDLGTHPSNVEHNLKEIFRVAQIWDCILLLDEADVFLSERNPTQLERNALVSVFLRMIEYYTGILFLTTNLPGSFDEAFKSRIHISLYYQYLNRKDTLKIWDMNLHRLKEIEKQRAEAKQQPVLTIDEKGIAKFAKRHYRTNEDGKGRWNGRQIRNAFLIASALAHFERDNPSLVKRAESPSRDGIVYDIKPRHFEVVAEASMGFERYLLETKGQTAGQIAFQRGLRADFVRSPSEKLESSSLVPTHDQSGGSGFREPSNAGRNQLWGNSAHRMSERYPPSQRQSYNGDLWDEQQEYQERRAMEMQFAAQQMSHRGRKAVSPGTGGAQESPSSWTPSRQSRTGLLQALSSGRFVTEDDRGMDDSEDSE
ncbi:uncharacterized protein N7459_006198 [Penicillium hispanicum]|uniref:uncharacterized protein n=1 Tax=Penicillium hispanicum TaxID=1080232 RepID=UPI00254037C0|nr:uncharacterized protein N7459_006198 [Penicillium hispanicum]KAJ5580213.1 hypothetical protein N7459_006198 [Penicillium hispanicum]